MHARNDQNFIASLSIFCTLLQDIYCIFPHLSSHNLLDSLTVLYNFGFAYGEWNNAENPSTASLIPWQVLFTVSL